MDLIDRKALLRTINEYEKNEHCGGLMCQEIVMYEIEDAPTVDAEPVRHGKWILLGGNFRDKDIVYYKCSECGRQEWKQEPYCHCGAKMDGD